jgi:hypothetical protein
MVKFCECALIPTLNQMEPSKNFATVISEKNDVTINRLSNTVIFLCSTKIMKKMNVTEEQVTTILLPCLRLLVGGGEPFRMVYAQELGSAFSQIRLSLFKNNFFRRIRGVLTMKSDSMMSNIDTDESVTVIKRPLQNSAGDILLSICMFLVTADSTEKPPDNVSSRAHSFAAEILTVPMVTNLLSEEGRDIVSSRLCVLVSIVCVY